MPSSSIPADVVQCVFDCLDLSNICSCAHVSRMWRKLARGHPTFWKKLYLTDDFLSEGEAAFFVDQLCSRSEPYATFSLFLRCTTHCPIMIDHVLPNLCANIHRAQELSLILTPESLAAFSPLFSRGAPYLSTLRLIVHEATVDMPELTAVFQCQAFSALRRVLLFDVPLSESIPPLSHTVDALQAVYIGLPAHLPRALRWIPRTRALDPLTLQRKHLPHPSRLRLDSVTSLVVYDEHWLRHPRAEQIPTLIIGFDRPSSEGVRDIVPRDGPVCACIVSTPCSISPGDGICGRAAVGTEDGKVIRFFDYLDGDYASSPTFMASILPSSRLVTLAVSLNPVFRRLCEMNSSFPLLRTLILGIHALPSEDDISSWGCVTCAALTTIVLQEEEGALPVSLSTPALEQFITGTLSYTTTTALQIVLKGVDMVREDFEALSVASVSRQSAMEWFACTPEHGGVSAVASVRRLPQMPWVHMDGLEYA